MPASLPPALLFRLHQLPGELWIAITRLGEMQLMLPIGFALIAWLAWSGERLLAAGWLALLLTAVGITTASKIAFIGWGVGSASLNFTGFSGHAMHAAAVLPLLMGCVSAGATPGVRRAAIALGLLVAALVGLSRVVIGAHSPSEALFGFLLGALASVLSLTLGHPPRSHLPRWLLATVIAAALLNSSALPPLPTHSMVTRLALELSGRERPYTRHMMLQEEKLRRQRAREIVLAAPVGRPHDGTSFSVSVGASARRSRAPGGRERRPARRAVPHRMAARASHPRSGRRPAALPMRTLAAWTAASPSSVAETCRARSSAA